MNEAFYKFMETRAQAGYGSAIVVKEQADDNAKYSLLIAGETVPSVFGTADTFEFDLINSPVKGKVMGKTTLDDKEVEYLLHRDNVYRLQGLKNKVLDFMYVSADGMGWKFTGTIKYRPNDAEADVAKGTYTISPMSADENPILDVRGMIAETIAFTESIPDKIDNLTTTGTVVNFTTDITAATISCVVYDYVNGVKGLNASTNIEGTVSGKNVTFKQKSGADTGTHYAIAFITATVSGNTNYADWTTTVALSTTKAGA